MFKIDARPNYYSSGDTLLVNINNSIYFVKKIHFYSKNKIIYSLNNTKVSGAEESISYTIGYPNGSVKFIKDIDSKDFDLLKRLKPKLDGECFIISNKIIVTYRNFLNSKRKNSPFTLDKAISCDLYLPLNITTKKEKVVESYVTQDNFLNKKIKKIKISIPDYLNNQNLILTGEHIDKIDSLDDVRKVYKDIHDLYKQSWDLKKYSKVKLKDKLLSKVRDIQKSIEQMRDYL